MLRYATLLLALSCVTSHAHARDFIIAGIPEEPLRWENEKGELTGIDVDLVRHVMKEINIPYQIILENSSARLLSETKAGNYDLVFTYSYKPERTQFLKYAQEPHMIQGWHFFYRSEDAGKYKFETYEDLKGVTIGATKGFSYTNEFWQAAEKGILDLDIVTQNSLNMPKLLHKRIDLLPYTKIVALYEAQKDGYADKIKFLPKAIKEKPYFNTFPLKSSYPDQDNIIAQYDSVLKKMKANGELAEIFAKYGVTLD